jgi:Uma2 family endonuclease
MTVFYPPTSPAVDDPDLYPEEIPGLGVSESTRHHLAALDLFCMLDDRYRDTPDVFVAGNLYVYYEEGNPRAMVSPDVFVAFGVPRRDRLIYKLWEEPAGPTVVFEVTSKTTRAKDVILKKEVYARLGVAEYFLYDPLWEYLKPPLRGLRLVRGTYQEIEPDSAGMLASERLGLRVSLDGWQIGLADAGTGEKLVRPSEEAAIRRVAELHAAALEAENARLHAEIERLRKEDVAGL